MSLVVSDDVEVLVDGDWFHGVLRGWSQRDGVWWATVVWSREGFNYIDTFPAARVRQVEYCPWYRGHHECLGWDGCTLPAQD